MAQKPKLDQAIRLLRKDLIEFRKKANYTPGFTLRDTLILLHDSMGRFLKQGNQDELDRIVLQFFNSYLRSDHVQELIQAEEYLADEIAAEILNDLEDEEEDEEDDIDD